MAITFEEIRNKIEEYLNTALKITEFDITFAKLDEKENIWKVNVEFKEKGDEEFTKSALFGLDVDGGDIKQFKKGEYWRF